MANHGYTAEQAPGTRSDAPTSESGGGDNRATSFDCCGTWMNDATAECPCGSFARRHPVVTSAILAVMGLAVLVIPAGAILGIIAFLRTI